jgi:phosphatidylinositol alpha-1,6-mannosyltransferase
MNLAIITQDFPPELGGLQTFAAEHAKRFQKECEAFFVIAPDKPRARQFDKNLSYPVSRIKTSNPFLGLKAIPKARQMFKKYGVRNSFHIQWHTLPASLYAKRQGLVDKIFVSVQGRDMLFNPFYSLPGARQGYELYKGKMLAQVDRFFPASDYMAGLLSRHGVEDERIKVIINGTDPARFYPENTDQARRAIGFEGDEMVLTVSRLVSKKGIDTTIKAFAKVLKRHPSSRYVIVGDGEQKEELQQLAINLGIADSVQFAGSIPHHHPDLIHYYNACDVFVHPSKTEKFNVEGFGIVFLEANACGKPVIGSLSGGIPNAVVDGETGILVKERDPEDLAAAINKLLDHPDLAAQMGTKGRRRVENTANWDVLNKQLLAAMKNTI